MATHLTQWFLPTWGALGVVLTSATQLRPDVETIAIGPGEVMLGVWSLIIILMAIGNHVSIKYREIIIFWIFVACLLGFGSYFSLIRNDQLLSLRDSIAFLMAAVISVIISLEYKYDMMRHFLVMLFSLTALAGTIMFLLALSSNQIMTIDPWYGTRFRGWSDNPNQLALFMVGMPFLGWYLMRTVRGGVARVACLLGIAGCVAVGIETESDGLRVAWIGTLAVLSVVYMGRALFRSRGTGLYLSHLVVPLTILTLLAAFGKEFLAQAMELSEQMYEDGQQGHLRLQLWRNGLEALAASPLVGLGPGAHSGIDRPFEGLEAHNSLIDWATNTGVIGVLLHLWLLTWTMWRCVRSDQLPLATVILALAIFGLFAHILRHPIYWALLTICFDRAVMLRRARPRWVGGVVAPPGVKIRA